MTTITTTTRTHRTGVAMASPTIWLERLLWLSWVPVVLYTIFFNPIADVHNGMHPLRHSTTIVQCH